MKEEEFERAEEEEENESALSRIILLVRVLLTIALLAVGFFWLNEENYGLWVNLAVMGAAWLIIGYDVVFKALKKLFGKGNPFDEHVLMTISTIGAFCLRFFGPENNEFLEGVLVMLLYQIGEFFQDLAADRSRDAITAAIDLRNDHASVICEDGSLVSKTPEEIAIGDVYLFKVGEKALADGEVIEGVGEVDESSLTGEFMPVAKTVGSIISSGTLLKSGSLKVQATKEYKDSTVKKLLDLVENNVERKSKTDRFITKFAKVYTPIVMGLAILVGVIPPLFLGIGDGEVWSRWIYTALSFLVISCPCSIVIAVPLAYFAGLGLASKNGILVKGGEYFDKLNTLQCVAFDKTGTLTEGKFQISGVYPQGLEEEKFMEYLLAAESLSNHPLAKAIINGHELSDITAKVSSYEEIAGFGVRCDYEGHSLAARRFDPKKDAASSKEDLEAFGTKICLDVDGVFSGYLVLNDTLKDSAKDMVSDLHKLGVKAMLLSGDRNANVQAIAQTLSIDEYHGELTPEEKTALLEHKMAEEQGSTAFVGDGINDAPSIVLSDVGIAMGGLGSDMAVQNADVVFMNDDPYQVVNVWRIAEKTQRRAFMVIFISLFAKLACMVAAIAWSGFPLWAAVLADSGLAVAMVLVSLSLFWSKISLRKRK